MRGDHQAAARGPDRRIPSMFRRSALTAAASLAVVLLAVTGCKVQVSAADPGGASTADRALHRGRGAGRDLGRDQGRIADRRAGRGLLPRLQPPQRRPAHHRRDHVRVLRHHGRARPGGRGQARRAGAGDPGPAGAERELPRVLLLPLPRGRGDLVLVRLPVHPPEDRDHRRDEGRHHDRQPDQPVLRDLTGLPGDRYRTGRRIRHHRRVQRRLRQEDRPSRATGTTWCGHPPTRRTS